MFDSLVLWQNDFIRRDDYFLIVILYALQKGIFYFYSFFIYE